MKVQGVNVNADIFQIKAPDILLVSYNQFNFLQDEKLFKW